MYDISNIDMWKFKMSAYLKALGLHVYLATTKKSYLDNEKYLEANAQVIVHLGKHLAKNTFLWFLIMISLLKVEHIDLSQGLNFTYFGEKGYLGLIWANVLHDPREWLPWGKFRLILMIVLVLHVIIIWMHML